jgi:hypothetical protein
MRSLTASSRKRHLSPLRAGVLVAIAGALMGLAACAAGTPFGEPVYNVSADEPSAQVTAENEGGDGVVEVYSDNGIGRATITLVSGSWNDPTRMRFHLQALEGLQFAYGDTIVSLSVNTQQQILQSVTAGGAAEEQIGEDSSYWMPVAFFDSEGTAVDQPTAGGAIEVLAPADFFSAEHPEFTIHWLDFYR